MTIKIDHDKARSVLLEEHDKHAKVIPDAIMNEWIERVSILTDLCPYRKSSTFIAVLGTAILAKTVEPDVDVYCLLERNGGARAYSARTLVDDVWAKERAILGIDIGANRGNPLNNTPFIGKASIDEIKNVRNVEGFKYFKDCLNQLDQYTSIDDAKAALRGFISVRKQDYSSIFKVGENAGDYLVIPTLLEAIKSLVEADSEEGRCAQAIAAGLLSLVYGKEAIDVGHINDPDRNFPLDILVSQGEPADNPTKIAVEVKDKPVGVAEILAAVEKARKFGVTNVIYLAASQGQREDDFLLGYERARDQGCKLVLFTDWKSFTKACLSFTHMSGLDNFKLGFSIIGEYLQELGVSQGGVDLWSSFAQVKQ